jgi:hypothetical protein
MCVDNVPCSCKYSKQTGSLTDDILKTRAVQDIPKEQKQKDESKNEGDDKKKESKWTGKNSWRLGLLSLGGMVVMFGGSFIYLFIIDILIFPISSYRSQINF